MSFIKNTKYRVVDFLTVYWYKLEQYKKYQLRNCMSILAITKDNFQSDVINATKPVFIDVYATWCGPCQQMEPTIEALAQELGSKYVFGKVNVDESRDISIQLGITSVPTFVFFKDGQVVGKETGYMSKDDLKDSLERFLG